MNYNIARVFLGEYRWHTFNYHRYKEIEFMVLGRPLPEGICSNTGNRRLKNKTSHGFNKMIIVICGPSGVGKTSLAMFLEKKLSDAEFCISHTTRKPRITEMDGRDYFFVKKEEFEAMIEKGLFVECAEVYGNYYGTTWDSIAEAEDNGTAILDLDYVGAKAVFEEFGQSAGGVSVFSIIPPSLEVLKERLIQRKTDDIETINHRIQKIEKELEQSLHFPHVEIINDNMRETQKEILRCMKKVL